MSKSPKIGYIMSRFPTLTETFILYEMVALMKLGAEIEVYPLLRSRHRVLHPECRRFTERAHFHPFLSLKILQANWHYLRRRPIRYFRVLFDVLRYTWGSLNFFVGAIGVFPKSVRFAYEMERDSVTHVHAHFVNHPAVAGTIITRLTGIPFSFTAHGSDLHVERRMLSQKLDAAAFAVTISEYNKEMIVSHCGAKVGDKVHVIHCGTDPGFFMPRRYRESVGQPMRIVVVGSLIEVKGHRYLLEACGHLTRRGVRFLLDIVGEGKLRQTLERQMAELGLQDCVRFHGGLSRQHVVELLQAADVAALTSIQTKKGKREGIPVVLMEAMACGLPVVASRISGIPELVQDGETGFLAAPQDSMAIANALHKLSRDRALRQKMGAAGRDRVMREFNLEHNAQLLLNRVCAPRKTVLILDGNQRSALAATRSLGEKGLRVVVADEFTPNLASTSRHCFAHFEYPSAFNNETAFIQTLLDECKRLSVDVIYPMTDISMYHVLKNRDRFKNIVIPCASFSSYEMLTDKWKLFELARELKVSIPQTNFVRDRADLETLRDGLRFPVVIKPYRSRIFSNGRWLKSGVHYADSWTELEQIVEKQEYFARHPFLLQQYIHGENQGVFTIYDQGRPLTFFCHRRLRERPPSGGIAVYAESIARNERTCDVAEKLLTHAGWHGVAMVEFKVDLDGTPYMLEINARFWATLQLAVDAGVDFPWLLYQLGTGAKPDLSPEYTVGRRSRWLLGDLAHLFMTMVGHGVNRYQTGPGRWRTLSEFFKMFDRRVWYEINRWSDLRPFTFEITNFLRRLLPRPRRVLPAGNERCDSA